MNHIVAVFLSLLLSLAQVHGQSLPLLHAGPGAQSSGGGGYSGPGDAISGAKAFFSCARAYNAAYANGTNPLCDLNAATGGASVCTLRVATSGFVDLAASYCAGTTPSAACLAASGGSCVVSKLYDQSGANACTGAGPCDVTQATLANMPALTFSALNSLPCLTFATGDKLATPGIFSPSLPQPVTVTVVAKRTGNFTTEGDLVNDSGSQLNTFFDTSANAVRMYAGGTSGSFTASDNAFHGLQFVASQTAAYINVDGTANSTTVGTTAFANGVGVGGTFSGTTGLICEGGVYAIGFSTGQQTTMFNNMNGSSGYNGGL